MTKSLRKLKCFIYFGGLLLLIGLVYQWFVVTHSSQSKQPITTAELNDIVQTITISGKIIPKRRTLITAPYKGYIQNIQVSIGDQVKQGDPIVSVVQALQSDEQVYPIRAPYSGTVVQVNKEEGQYVPAGEDKNFIVEIDDLSELYIHALVPELDIVKLQLNQHATVKITPIKERTYSGVVKEIALATEVKEQSFFIPPQAGYPVRILLAEVDQQMKPGMSVLVDIITTYKEQALSLPHEYVYQNNDQAFVVLKKGYKQPVTLGIQNESLLEITEGLQVGDEVMRVNYYELEQYR